MDQFEADVHNLSKIAEKVSLISIIDAALLAGVFQMAVLEDLSKLQ